MDTEKLITVTVWATLVLIGYEVLKKFYGGTPQAIANLPSSIAAESANLLSSADQANLQMQTAMQLGLSNPQDYAYLSPSEFREAATNGTGPNDPYAGAGSWTY